MQWCLNVEIISVRIMVPAYNMLQPSYACARKDILERSVKTKVFMQYNNYMAKN